MIFDDHKSTAGLRLITDYAQQENLASETKVFAYNDTDLVRYNV